MHNENRKEVFRDIEITFTRNIPADEAALINMINSLKGTVSDETLLGLLPFIPDVDKELERVKAQKESNIDLFGGGLFDDSESESQEDEDGTEDSI